MQITISRLLYYTTVTCVVLALLRILRFDSTCIQPLFYLPMIIVGYNIPDPAGLTRQQATAVIFGAFVFLISLMLMFVGLFHLHTKMLDWTKPVAGKKEGE